MPPRMPPPCTNGDRETLPKTVGPFMIESLCVPAAMCACVPACLCAPPGADYDECLQTELSRLTALLHDEHWNDAWYGCRVDRWMASPPHRHHLPNFFARVAFKSLNPSLPPSRLTRSFRPIAELFAGVRPCTFMCQLPCLNDDHSAKRWIGFSPPKTPPPPSFKSPTNWFHNLRIINATYWHYDGASPTRWHYL